MSDRRPSNPELVVVELNHNVSSVDPSKWHTREASVDEVLAYVRRGVESGEIEGEVRKSIVTVDPEDGGEAFYVRVPHDGYWLMIPAGGATNGPVSDGGSET